MLPSRLFRRIKTLHGIQPQGVERLNGHAMKEAGTLDNAYLWIEGGIIKAFGPDSECPIQNADEVIDASGRIVIPAYCDSHTHLVFSSWRENEFEQRVSGFTYEEIAQAGGGILNSARKLQDATEESLFESALTRLEEVVSLGTGAIEIKSGYGLSFDAELKMLRVIRRLKEKNIIPIVATFLGAHAIPAIYKSNRQGYIDLLTKEMVPAIASEGLAEYIDVFCDRGFFTVEETEIILEAGAKYGLPPKIHANELGYTGGIQVGVKHNAISVDHLEYTGPEEIEALRNSSTIATILPSTAFFLGLPYAPAREMLDNNLCVALASDYNPGSSPSGNMSFIFSLASIKLKMTPVEALWALTLNGAAAMNQSGSHGSITIGKAGSVILTEPTNGLAYLPYSFGIPRIERVFIATK